MKVAIHVTDSEKLLPLEQNYGCKLELTGDQCKPHCIADMQKQGKYSRKWPLSQLMLFCWPATSDAGLWPSAATAGN